LCALRQALLSETEPGITQRQHSDILVETVYVCTHSIPQYCPVSCKWMSSFLILLVNNGRASICRSSSRSLLAIVHNIVAVESVEPLVELRSRGVIQSSVKKSLADQRPEIDQIVLTKLMRLISPRLTCERGLLLHSQQRHLIVTLKQNKRLI
jgi:hypothetical protein